MKYKYKKIVSSTLVLSGVVAFFATSILLPTVFPSKAYAAATSKMSTPQYALYYSENSVEDLNAAAKTGDGGIGPTEAQGVLSQTMIATKDGPLGTQILKLDSEKTEKNNLPTYSIDYYCSPTQNYKIGTTKPADSVPYVRYTLGVTVLKPNNWSGLTTLSSYETHDGLLGEKAVGTVHWPQNDKIIESPPRSGPKSAQDFDLPSNTSRGWKQDMDLTTSIQVGGTKPNQGYVEDADFTFDKYPGGSNAQNKRGFDGLQYAFDQCSIPKNTTLQKVINYQKNTGQKEEWDKAIKQAGLGNTLADAASSTTESGNADGPGISCKIGWNLSALNPLNWLLCGAIKGMVSIISVLDDAITKELAVGTDGSSAEPTQIFCNSGPQSANCKAYYTAWKNFRNIALGLMVLAGLVIVMSQALGFEYFDPYMIKKTLPRLIIAAIGIALSWQLMAFFVELTNALGYGIRYLIYAPFVGVGDAKVDLQTLGANGAVLIAGLAGIAFGGFGLLTLAGTGALALLIAFIVLILRQIAIILLIVLAPIGIVAYVLPNTQKVWKLWWESFSKALLMFPLIAGLIAAGKVFSAIASSADGNNVLNQMIAFAAYFAPFFLIPYTFKFAGGALAQIGGFVNNKSQGGFAFLKQKRRENAGKRFQRARTGKLWREDFGQFGAVDPKTGKRKSIGSIASRIAELGLDADEQIPYMLGARNVPGLKGYYTRTRNTLDAKGVEHTQKLAQKLEAAGLNKQAYRALTGQFDGLSGDTKQRLAEAGFLTLDAEGNATTRVLPSSRAQWQQVASIMQQSSYTDDVQAGRSLDGVAGMLSSLNHDEEMVRASVSGAALVGLAARGYAEDTDIAAVGNQMSNERNHMFAQQVIGLAEKTGAQYHPEIKFGHSVTVDKNGNYAASSTDLDRSIGTVSSIGSNDWLGAKKEAIIAREDAIKTLASETTVDAEGHTVPTERALAMQRNIAQGAAQWTGSSPDAKAEWQRIIKELDAAGVKEPMRLYSRGDEPSDGEKAGRPQKPPKSPIEGQGLD